MSNVRFNSISGLIEDKDGIIDVSLHFNEWWNGEGLDFTFYDKNEKETKISLHYDEIRTLAVASLVSGFLDLEELKEKSEDILLNSKKKELELNSFKDSYSF